MAKEGRKQRAAAKVFGIMVSLVAVALVGWLVISGRLPGDGSPSQQTWPPIDEARLSAQARRGAELFRTRGCISCHTTDGTDSIGPSVRGAWGSQRELQDGSVVVVDEAYVRESIVEPRAKLVRGYLPAMSSYAWLPDEEIEALIAFIREIGQ